MRAIIVVLSIISTFVMTAQGDDIIVEAPGGIPQEVQQAIQAKYLDRPEIQFHFTNQETRARASNQVLRIAFAGSVSVESGENSVTVTDSNDSILFSESFTKFGLKQFSKWLENGIGKKSALQARLTIKIVPVLEFRERIQDTLQVVDLLHRGLPRSDNGLIVQLVTPPGSPLVTGVDRYVTISVEPTDKSQICHVKVLDANRKIISQFDLDAASKRKSFHADLLSQLFEALCETHRVKRNAVDEVYNRKLTLNGKSDFRLAVDSAPPTDSFQIELTKEQRQMVAQKDWEAVAKQMESWETEFRSLMRIPARNVEHFRLLSSIVLRRSALRKLAAEHVPPSAEALQMISTRIDLEMQLSPVIRMWQDDAVRQNYHEALVSLNVPACQQLASKWHEVVTESPEEHFAEYSRRVSELTHLLVHQLRNDNYVDPQAAKLAANIWIQWIDEFEKLKESEKYWFNASGALNVAYSTPTFVESDRVYLDPVWDRLEKSGDPFLSLLRQYSQIRSTMPPFNGITDADTDRLRKVYDDMYKLGTPQYAESARAVASLKQSLVNHITHIPGQALAEARLEIAEKYAATGFFDEGQIVSLLRPWDDASAKRCIEVFRKAQSKYPRINVDFRISQWAKEFPGLRTPSQDNFLGQMREVLDIKDQGNWTKLHDFHHVPGIDDAVFGLLSNYQNAPRCRLLRVNLISGETTELSRWEADVPVICCSENALYAATRGELKRFDPNGNGPGEFVPLLLNTSPTAMVAVGDTVFLGTEQGRVYEVSLRGQSRSEIIGPSTELRLADSESQRLEVSTLLYDEPRNRLLIVSADRGVSESPANGVFSYDLKTHVLQRLFGFGRIQGLGVTAQIDGDILEVVNTWILRCNLKTGEYSLIANYDVGEFTPTVKQFVGFAHHPLLVGNTYWSMSGTALHSMPISGGSGKDWPTLVEQRRVISNGRPRFFDLIPLSPSTVLIRSSQQLIVTKLPTENP